VGLGFGSNFTDSYAVQYTFSTRLSRALSLNATFSYDNYTASNIGGESGNRYLYYRAMQLTLVVLRKV
jgi:hypothetical protein